MNKFETKVQQYIQERRMIRQGDAVLVGLSGGADSVCLLLVLHAISRRMQFHLLAMHVVHGIRAYEAQEDAEFCAQLCERLHIPFLLETVDVPKMAKQEHLSVEEAGRRARYDAFERVALEQGLQKIAVAHHMEDNAETFLFQLIRGSMITGLRAIPAERGQIIRPLLDVTRKEIEDYLAVCGQEYCTDHTNLQTQYSRNKIRLEVLPRLQEINAQALSHIHRSAALMVEVDAMLARQAGELKKETLVEVNEERIVLSLGKLREAEPLIVSELLYESISQIRGSKQDLTEKHIAMVMQLLRQQSGRSCDLPGDLVALREFDHIVIRRKAAEHFGQEPVVLDKDALYQEVRFGDYCIYAERMTRREVQKTDIETENPYTKYVDYDKITVRTEVRMPAGGDVISLDEAGHNKKLNRYFIDKKVPEEQRSRKVLITEGNRVIWVVGERIGYRYRISDQTTQVWKLHAERINHE